MTDLHAWITQQVDRAEESARAQLQGQRLAIQPHDGGPAVTGTVTGVTQTAEGLHLDVSQYGAEPVADAWVNVPAVAAALCRCEADRRILARHLRDPDCLAWAACKGCGNDDWGLPNVDNINDCPELLDLAHAHGMTDEILAGLDQPQTPQPKPVFGGRLGLGDILATRPITTSDVPEALRGPRWKP